MRNHPEYHDVCQQVAHFEKEADERMDVDFEAGKGITKPSDGRFERSALQQVIYVKRKTYQETEDMKANERDCSDRVTSLALLLRTGPAPADLKSRAVQALRKLLEVKDPSIKAFLRAFIGELDSCDENLLDVLQAHHHRSLQQQASLSGPCFPSANGMSGQTKRAKKRVMAALEKTLTLKKQLMTLVALEECYVHDKVAALPLLLSLFDACAQNDSAKIEAYTDFIEKAAAQFSFMGASAPIVPREITCLLPEFDHSCPDF